MIRYPLTKQRRGGFLLQETIMAILVVTAVIAGAGQLLQLVAAQRRAEEFRALASLETSNVMEDLLSRDWGELTPQAPRAELSRACRERLPAPQLRIEIVQDEGDTNSRRISVEIDWQAVDGRRGRPARLVAWRYQTVEVKP